MRLHYRFNHFCGHTGIGPIISGNEDGTSPFSSPCDNQDNENLTTIKLTFTFSCPFCPTSATTPTTTPAPEVPLGHGILTILNPSFPWSWSVLRSCKHEEITPQDWALSMGETGGYRQMAWIPKPCGEIRVVGVLEELRREEREEVVVITEVACTWRQKADEPIKSRFAGMLSQLNAAVLSGERAGR
jgi:hypothetical protein